MSLYDELGARPGDSLEELHRAYRARARELHPDVAGPGAEERMRRLNQAWDVLRDPQRRAAYDAGAWASAGAWDEEAGWEEDTGWDEGGAAVVGPHRFARRAPWVVTLAVLGAIFVVTAYVAMPAPLPRPTGMAGRCLVQRPGLDVVQECGHDSTEREIIAAPPCPTSTERHQLVGRSQEVCLAP